MRTFKIREAKKKNRKDGYYVQVEFMVGDADGYIKKKFGPFYDDETEYLDMFLDILDKCVCAFPKGKGGCDTYEYEVTELKVWLIDYYPEDDEEEEEYDKLYEALSEKCKEIIERIEFEIETDYNCEQTTILKYRVFYYKNNTCHYVEIE